MATDIERLLDEIRSLSEADKARLSKALSLEPTSGNGSTAAERSNKEYQELLVQAGLMREATPRRRAQDSFDRIQPVQVGGKPVSETIVEERR